MDHIELGDDRRQVQADQVAFEPVGQVRRVVGDFQRDQLHLNVRSTQVVSCFLAS